MDELYKHIVDTYSNGFYIYSFVINFKPDSDWSNLHPSKSHGRFTTSFEKYCKRHPTISYIVFAELSMQGKYHVHGLIFDKESEYDVHEKRIKLIRNYWSRRYGWTGSQRIYSLTDPYKTTDLRFMHKNRTTSFLSIWKYITKDLHKFAFLKPFANV